MQLTVYTHDVVTVSSARLHDDNSRSSGNVQRIIQTTLYGNRNAKRNRSKQVETQVNTLAEASREV